MVGEMRDAETANIAIHAALTGHLVLTTLHTETAAAAVPRLLDLGVEGFLLKSTLRAVIAQRLVRLLCDRCRVAQKRLTAADLAADPRYGMLGFKAGETVCEPGGCERCGGTGYRGRSGVFECLEMTEPVRKLIGAAHRHRHRSRRPRVQGRHDHHDRGRGRQMPRRRHVGGRSAARDDGAGEFMPNFRYKALTQAGEIVTGSIAAPTAAEVARRIEYLGLVPVDTVTEERADERGQLLHARASARSPRT